ncbi:MAG: hypothetical protein WCX08_00630 [Candidatus Buchananbacteria bacterium]|jgi:hypothetical protein
MADQANNPKANSDQKVGADVFSQKELQKLLAENLKISRETREMVMEIKRWIFWNKVWTAVKFLIIVIPLIISLIYLPALINKFIKPYIDVINLNQGESGATVLDQVKSLINSPAQQNLKNNAGH